MVSVSDIHLKIFILGILFNKYSSHFLKFAQGNYDPGIVREFVFMHNDYIKICNSSRSCMTFGCRNGICFGRGRSVGQKAKLCHVGANVAIPGLP